MAKRDNERDRKPDWGEEIDRASRIPPEDALTSAEGLSLPRCGLGFHGRNDFVGAIDGRSNDAD